jgi:methylated-DNA-[protein]-cysteine S-methyltransferase
VPPRGAPAEQLGEYFAGARRAFTIPLDLPAAPAFRRCALDELLRIPYGTTISYAELAARAGNGAAAPAAGRACATNPLPVVVPCHRVVASDGSLTWYAGGLRSKELLLRLEGARPALSRTRAPSRDGRAP